MSSAPHTLFFGMVCDDGIDEGRLKSCFVLAEHIGVAIEIATRSALGQGLTMPYCVQMGLAYKCADEIDDNAFTTDDNIIWWSNNVYTYPPAPDLMGLPLGIILPGEDGEQNPDDIRAGYEIRSYRNPDSFTLRLNVDRESVEAMFEQMLRVVDDYVVFWVLIHDHWDNLEQQFLTNESINTASTMMAFIETHRASTLHNGMVTLNAYRKAGSTSIRLSDHKLIEIATLDRSLLDPYVARLKSLGYAELTPMVTIEEGIYHYHYRPSASLSREEFVAMLCSSGFSKWNPNGA
jgi:hypothetical protein